MFLGHFYFPWIRVQMKFFLLMVLVAICKAGIRPAYLLGGNKQFPS